MFKEVTDSFGTGFDFEVNNQYLKARDNNWVELNCK
jgi:hypothetical protein